MTQYFAEIDDNNIVTQVIVAGQSFVDSLGGKWVETAMDGSIRHNYAGIGYTYDAAKDVFIAPQPFPSWTLDATSSGKHQRRTQQTTKCILGMNQLPHGKK